MQVAAKHRPPTTLLYLVAGVPLGIFAEVMPVFLRTSGMSLEHIGWFSAINLPYSFKALLAPVVDRVGRLRRWLGGLGLALLLAYLALAWSARVPSAAVVALALLAMTCASATFDIALDATFVTSLFGASEADHGRANARRLSAFKSAMVAVASLGVIAGGLVGFAATFAAIAAVHAAAMLAVPFARLPDESAAASAGGWLRDFGRWIRAPGVARAFALAFFYKLPIASFLWMEKTFWVDRGVSLQRIGTAAAIAGLVGTLAGANLGSRLAHRFGLLVLLRAGLVAQALLALGYWGLDRLPPHDVWLCAGLSLSGLAFGGSTAALMNLITRLCEPAHAATQFAALTGCYGLARSFGGLLAGRLAESVGYAGLFLWVMASVIPALLLLPGDAAAFDGRRP